MMATYRCNDCGAPIFTGDNLSGGSIRMTCPNRQCVSRRKSPPRQQTYVFGSAAQAAQGVGQKALRGSARRGR